MSDSSFSSESSIDQDLELNKSDKIFEESSIFDEKAENFEENNFELNFEKLNSEQRQTFDLFLNPATKSLFLSGSAGTGKSFLLKLIIEKLRKDGQGVAVTAPTGVAAFNINGMTLHSFSGYPLSNQFNLKKLKESIKNSATKAKNYLENSVLIIDEISMVSGEMLDHLDEIAQYVRQSDEPFGGLKLLFCGDFFQLPPVKKNDTAKFAFESNFWRKNMKNEIFLQKIVRQKDEKFAKILNEIRTGKISENSSKILEEISKNSEISDFFSPKILEKLRNFEEVSAEELILPTKLRPTKREVERINTKILGSLPGNHFCINALDWNKKGHPPSSITEGLYPASLRLKINCQVIILKNISVSEGVVNGTTGIVRKILYRDKEITQSMSNVMPEQLSGIKIRVELLSGKTVDIKTVTHDIQVNNQTVASRTQLPLDLAYAVTIHKSQGQTLEKVDVDLRNIFENGQTYVALSRVKSLEGLKLRGFDVSKVLSEPKVLRYYESITSKTEPELSEDDEIEEIPIKQSLVQEKQLPPPPPPKMMPVAVMPPVKMAWKVLEAENYLAGLKEFIGAK